jgi:Sulfotransferase domain.
VVLRDPVERAHSNWTHLWSAGLEPVGDFVRACGEEERRVAAGWASFWHYTGLGRYGEQLEYLFTLFPREQVLVLRYRRLVDEPAQTLDRSAVPRRGRHVLTEIPRQNVTSHPEPTLGHRAVSAAQRAASAFGTLSRADRGHPDRPARALPPAAQPRAPAAELGAAPGAHPEVRVRHPAARAGPRRELPGLDLAPGTFGRHGRRPSGRSGPGQERPPGAEGRP